MATFVQPNKSQRYHLHEYAIDTKTILPRCPHREKVTWDSRQRQASKSIEHLQISNAFPMNP